MIIDLHAHSTASDGTDSPAELMAAADRALDEAVRIYHWYRRLSGDARKKNPILDALYKGI